MAEAHQGLLATGSFWCRVDRFNGHLLTGNKAAKCSQHCLQIAEVLKIKQFLTKYYFLKGKFRVNSVRFCKHNLS